MCATSSITHLHYHLLHHLNIRHLVSDECNAWFRMPQARRKKKSRSD
jgi:hypothetical protein